MSLDPELYHVVKKLKEAKDSEVPLSENQLLDLFLTISTSNPAAAFGQSTSTSAQTPPHHTTSTSTPPVTSRTSSAESVTGGGGGHGGSGVTSPSSVGMMESGSGHDGKDREPDLNGVGVGNGVGLPGLRAPHVLPNLGGVKFGAGLGPSSVGVGTHGSTSRELNLVLAKLKDVDQILEHLAIFWAQTEVILDVLLQKSDHGE